MRLPDEVLQLVWCNLQAPRDLGTAWQVSRGWLAGVRPVSLQLDIESDTDVRNLGHWVGQNFTRLQHVERINLATTMEFYHLPTVVGLFSILQIRELLLPDFPCCRVGQPVFHPGLLYTSLEYIELDRVETDVHLMDFDHLTRLRSLVLNVTECEPGSSRVYTDACFAPANLRVLSVCADLEESPAEFHRRTATIQLCGSLAHLPALRDLRLRVDGTWDHAAVEGALMAHPPQLVPAPIWCPVTNTVVFT